MANITLPSQAYLRQCFDYDPDTGVLRWVSRPREHFASEGSWKVWLTKWSGKEAGSPGKHGYPQVGITGRLFLCHRIIWKIQTGLDPEYIDHINGNRADNRFANLRACTHAQNIMNRKLGNNTSGVRGVRPHGSSWEARIALDGVTHQLGSFRSLEEAAEARRAAELRLFGGFAHRP